MFKRASEQKWVTVRIKETSDGLIIHPDDRREYGLEWDQLYKGYITDDGNFRVPLPQPDNEPKEIVCRACAGTGKVLYDGDSYQTCRTCKGKRFVPATNEPKGQADA
ncbi:hypothetical protein [Shinella oryzae]|uniref:Uncharacterized protein n=1 Tax=Shinella oryzae TaxID=2871820 RepID=A0ABY9JZD4_9HYPH|nr:hypothetical protein [Shinella oryzae]WLS01692.1 hypothetical protein Q9315_09545 [Shinella oryzae]